MINYLRGKTLLKKDDFVVLDVNGVGYKVFVNSALLSDLAVNVESEVYIYHHIREDISALYGFRDMDELVLFEMLLSISGIGPKSAIGVLTIASVADIKDSIARGDSGLLIKVSGIGKKTAERVVLELQDKVGRLVISNESITGTEGTRQSISSSSDEIDALLTLGYSLQQARDALRKVDPEIKDSGERIREALKNV